MEKISAVIKRHKDILLYLVFGVLTTVVNYIVYFPLYNTAQLPAALSNGISWAVAVAFAFVTNKPFVFNSNDWSAKTLIPELMKFVGCRIGSGLAETAILFLTVDILQWSGNLWKILTSILVVILNYIFSKLIVFKK